MNRGSLYEPAFVRAFMRQAVLAARAHDAAERRKWWRDTWHTIKPTWACFKMIVWFFVQCLGYSVLYLPQITIVMFAGVALALTNQVLCARGMEMYHYNETQRAEYEHSLLQSARVLKDSLIFIRSVETAQDIIRQFDRFYYNLYKDSLTIQYNYWWQRPGYALFFGCCIVEKSNVKPWEQNQ